MSPVRRMCGRIVLMGAAVGAVVGLIGCREPRAAPPAPPPPVVTTTRPVLHPVQTYFEYNGNLDAVEVVQVVARVQGFLDEIAFTEGQDVAKDDLLFKIDPREYTAAVKRAVADKRKATAELKRSQSEEARAKKLRLTGAMSEEELEQRVGAREVAEAAVMQAEAAQEAAELQFGYTEIRSPIDGQISRTLVTRGNLVGQNGDTLLTTIVSMDPLYVYFDVPERDLVEYQRKLAAESRDDDADRTARLEVGVATDEGYPHVGRIDFRENRVDQGTGTVRIRGRVPNPSVEATGRRRLYPGLYARVRVPSGSPRSLPAVPEDALMTGQEGRFVYVVGPDDVIEKRTVTVGPTIWKGAPGADPSAAWSLAPADSAADPDSPPADPSDSVAKPVPSVVAIESGLSPDDQIVITGLTKSRPGAPVAPVRRTLVPPASAADAP